MVVLLVDSFFHFLRGSAKEAYEDSSSITSRDRRYWQYQGDRFACCPDNDFNALGWPSLMVTATGRNTKDRGVILAYSGDAGNTASCREAFVVLGVLMSSVHLAEIARSCGVVYSAFVVGIIQQK